MKARAKIAVVAVLLTLAGSLFAAQRVGIRYNQQYEREMQDPTSEDPPDAGEKTEFAFARLRYRGPGQSIRSRWGTDSNKAERQFMQGVRRLTRIHTRSVEEIIDADSEEVFNWPWLYAVEVGGWELSDAQAKRLRDYLDRGGFLMVDDFHGSYEWAAFMASLKRIFPDREVVDLQNGDQVFHILYDLGDRVQVPGLQFVRSGRTYEKDGYNAEWRAVLDDNGRIQVAICHNMDLGDAWEWADLPQYPEKYTSMAYRIGINYIVYALSH
jgi:Domain of unknown function (DUF4159)